MGNEAVWDDGLIWSLKLLKQHFLEGSQTFSVFFFGGKKHTHLSHEKRAPPLVGGWTNPSEKYARQIGNLPQIGVNIKNIWNHHLVLLSITLDG